MEWWDGRSVEPPADRRRARGAAEYRAERRGGFVSGGDAKGLGTDKSNLGANLIVSYESEPWGVHLHLGYFGNRNVHDERDVIRHASVAAMYMATERLKLVVDLGNSRRPTRR